MIINTYKRVLFFIFIILCNNILGLLPEKLIIVIIPSYNNAQWYEGNLNSVFKQNYSNYKVIYIDDLSTDGTGNLVDAYIKKMKQDFRCTLIKNTRRCGALENLYNAIHGCEDAAIIVTLDGDDRFAHTEVLKKINEVYSTQNVWLTHGKFIEFPTGWQFWSEPMPDYVIRSNSYRQHRPHPSHLRTFYAKLFKLINVEDLKYNGRFFEMTWDQAMMFPMIEMAAERHCYISEILYVYNTATSINDNKVNAQLQRDLEAIIRNRKPYSRLEALF